MEPAEPRKESSNICLTIMKTIVFLAENARINVRWVQSILRTVESVLMKVNVLVAVPAVTYARTVHFGCKQSYPPHHKISAMFR